MILLLKIFWRGLHEYIKSDSVPAAHDQLISGIVMGSLDVTQSTEIVKYILILIFASIFFLSSG